MLRFLAFFGSIFLMAEYFLQDDPNTSLLAMLVITAKTWLAGIQ